MIHDAIILAALVTAFSILVTAHVAIAFGLTRRAPHWRGPAALVIVPLAPLWGWRQRMRVRCVVWIVAALAYLVALRLALS